MADKTRVALPVAQVAEVVADRDCYRDALMQIRAILNPSDLPIWAWNPTRSADALRVIEAAFSRERKA